MFHRSSARLATVALIALSSSAWGANYSIGTSADVIAADGFCSLREAILASNTQRGHIGGVFSDERGVQLAAAPGDVSLLSFDKHIRNVTRGTSFLIAGANHEAARGDVLEYRITITASETGGDVEGVTLAFLLPQDDPDVHDGGVWKGYKSTYIAGSTLLNNEPVDDVGGFPLANPLQVHDRKVADNDTTHALGTIREGRQAEIRFRVRVEAGDNEPEAELIPTPEREQDIRYNVEAECAAGSGSNTVYLPSVDLESEDDQVEFQLDAPLVIGGGVNRAGTAVASSVSLEPRKTGPFDRVEKKNVLLHAPAGDRLFEVKENAGLTLSGMSLFGAGAVVGEDGGLIYAEGSVQLRAGTVISGGEADNGGAIYLAGRSGLSMEQVRFEDNAASMGNGGAIATASDYQGVISGSRIYFTANRAVGGKGGAIYVDGTSPAVRLENVTFYDNEAVDGAAIRFEAESRISDLSNLTVAGNASTAGAALSWSEASGDSGRYDALLNSFLGGNVGDDCAADDPDTLDDADIAYVVSVGATPDEPGCGPLDERYYSLDGKSFDHTLVSFALLAGRNPADPADENLYSCDAVDGPGGCRPIEFDDGLAGFLPNLAADETVLGLVGDPALHILPTVLDAGVSPESLTYACASNDQRGKLREDRCDAGAIELRIAAGTDDEFIVVQGQTVLLDVVQNDLGDLTVDCTLLPAPAAPEECIGFFLTPSRVTAGPYVWVSGVVSAANPDGRQEVTLAADRKGVFYNRDPIGTEESKTFPVGYPLVLVTTEPRFHGVDQMRYFLDRAALADNGPSFAGLNPSGGANLVIEPEHGLKNRGDITTLSGSFGGILLALGLLLQRRRKIWLALPLLLVVSGLQAADIRVTTLADAAFPRDNGFDRDGECSLREALLSAIDRNPEFFPDCVSGTTGRDRILIEVDGEIELQTTLQVFGSSVDIIGRGPANTIIRPACVDLNDDPLTCARRDIRLLQASSSLTLNNLTLQGGRSLDNHGGAIFTTGNLTLEGVELLDNSAAENGGAIYLSYVSGVPRVLSLRRVYASNNQAGLAGGVIGMLGQNAAHKLNFEAVTFADNSAATCGAALDINMPTAGTVRMVNSTLANNSVPAGACNGNNSAAVDLQDVSSSVTAYIINSTIIDNAPAGIELGDGNVSLTLSNSVYLGSGGCSTGSREPAAVYWNLFGLPRDCHGTSEDENDAADESDIRVLLGGATMAPAKFSEQVYTPPHFAIIADAIDTVTYPLAELLVNAGNTQDLATGLETPLACRATDLRGTSRKSGGGCDRGAFELQVPTALDDKASNQYRLERKVRINVLHNDFVGDGFSNGTDVVESEMKHGTIDLDPQTPGANDSNTIQVTTDNGTFDFDVVRAAAGRWEVSSGTRSLTEGTYRVRVDVRDPDDVAVLSASRTLIVRADGLRNEDDVFDVRHAAALSIDEVDGDTEGDFVVAPGVITVRGTTEADDNYTVELFIDGKSVGTAPVTMNAGACGGDAGTANDDDRCLVEVVPVSALSCDDLAGGGIEVTVPYRFSVYNGALGDYLEATAGKAVATVLNIVPKMKGETRRSVPGRVEEFRLDVIDPDGTLTLFNADNKSNVSLDQAPSFAATRLREMSLDGELQEVELVFGVEDRAIHVPSGNYVTGTEGLGLVVYEQNGEYWVRYTPRDAQGTFNDRFRLTFRDECGDTARADFHIQYKDASDVGGTLSPLWLVTLLLLRRRRHAL